ncbi:MAG: FG-GAP-like repeat-containing protein, partial [Bryobacteraceae bacterium]
FDPTTAMETAGAVNVLLNSSAGTAFATAVTYSAGTSPFSAVTADFNKDGKADVALISFNGQGGASLALLTGDGSGKLNAATFYPIDRNPAAIVTADFNGDGYPDVAITTGTGLNLLLNDGGTTFHTLGEAPAGPTPQGIAAADFNGDGKPDLAIAASGTGTPAGYSLVMLNRAATPPASLATVNAASFASNQPVAPLSIVSTFGSGLASQKLLASSVTTTLGGTNVSVTDSAGITRAANIFFVSPGQVNYEIPGGTATGIALFAVQKAGVTVASGFVEIAMVGPGVFSADGRIAAGGLIQVDSSGNQTAGNIVQCASGVCTAVPINVAAGKTFLILYGTGIRGAPLSQISVQAGGLALKPSFAGGQGTFAGLDQVNVQLPSSLAGAGDIAITVTATGVTSNAVHVTIQ